MKKVKYSPIWEIEEFLYTHDNISSSKQISCNHEVYINIKAYKKLDGDNWKTDEINWLLSDNDKEVPE